MNVRNRLEEIILSAVRYFPHKKVNLPYVRDRRVRINFYLDTELGLWLGYNEPSVIHWWKNNISEKQVVFDIGAHIGIYSLLAAVRGATVHAFEPDSHSSSRIRSQAIENDIGQLIIINNGVVSDNDEKAILYKDHSGREHSLRNSTTRQEEISVDSMTLDEYTSTSAVPDVIKIDVEGAADMVLAGAETIWDKNQIIWLIEIHNKTELDAVEEYFAMSERNIGWISNRHVVITPSS